MTRGTPIPETMTLHVPFRIVKRGGRKEMQMPDRVRPERTPDSTLVKAIARAFQWERMLETGRYATIKEIAKAEKINPSYVSRALKLTLWWPYTVKAILDRRHTPR